MSSYPTRFYRGGKPSTELIHLDALGRHVPLLDETGAPVNFERKPTALERARAAMVTMTKLWSPTITPEDE